MNDWKRRDILKLFSVGGVVFASGLVGCAGASAGPAPTTPSAPPGTPAPGAGVGIGGSSAGHEDFFFVQLSDTHVGYHGDANPEADGTLEKAIETINAVATKPDFIVFTGDLSQTTDDPKERRARLAKFKSLATKLDVKKLYFLPGEHDASLDKGEAYREFFGESRYSFDHKGVHFVALDNVSDPTGSLGDDQIEWLRGDLAKLSKNSPIVVFTHRPLFDLFPAWEWATKDGEKALAVLEPYENVTVFYGHIHQEHHQKTGRIDHYAARSLVFPLPAPGSVPKKAPIAWDPQAPFRGLGSRIVEAKAAGDSALTELPVTRA